jgi:hypothetical protein
MTVITTFAPYLYMFAALVRLQNVPAQPRVIRIIGGKPVATAIAALGFVSTTLVIVGSAIPDVNEPHKVLAVAKTIGLSAVLLGSGAVLYWLGKRRAIVADSAAIS